MELLSKTISIVFFVLFVFLFEPINSRNLLGARECTWGPGYWCANITNAKNCHAVRHCIQTVWEKQIITEDDDSVCQICLDMVKQARDQLESNQTEEDLKAVFEGSCKLIPLKPIQKECIKLADNFIPELVETLASQMNPQVVCSVAGLCNNARIDKMLAEAALTTTTTAATTTTTTSKPTTKIVENTSINYPADTKNNNGLSCSECNTIASIISNKFSSTNRDDILEGFLHFCGRLSSYSDACANIILSYFENIYSELKASVNSDAICHLSGVCSAKYHQHPELVEIRPMSNVGVVQVKDDIPCQLCEQLVKHLRDVLVANTTEEEFKQVLQGFCNQTRQFKEECLSIVDQYYDEIYKSLVNNLDANGACFMIGICPKGGSSVSLKNNNQEETIAPLLPAIPPQRIEVTIKEKPKKKLLGVGEPKYTKEEIQSKQLPIDKLLGPQHPGALVENGQWCTMCEYLLHFVQEALSSPKNEDKIKNAVINSCKKLPATIQGKCDDFVDMYGDAVIALLIQEIDPSQICPMLKICPTIIKDMEVFAPQTINVEIDSKSSTTDKPTCPLCLFAVEQAKSAIKSNKSKENIKHTLDTLCTHLPIKLQAECIDFIDTYSSELIEMLVSDFTAQEICSYLKLCPDHKPDLSELNIKIIHDKDNEILTNEIPDDTVNGVKAETTDKEVILNPTCYLCQKFVKNIENKILNPKSEDQIRNAIEHICNDLINPDIIKKCHNFIDKNSDLIVSLIMKELTPKMICLELGYCLIPMIEDLAVDEALKADIITKPSHSISTAIHKFEKSIITDTSCVICEFVMEKLEHELQNKTTQDEIKHIVQNICSKLPKTVEQNCKKFMDNYADLVLNLIDSVPPKEICARLSLCPHKKKLSSTIKNNKNSFSEIIEEVTECGMCHGITVAVNNLIKNENDDDDNSNNNNSNSNVDLTIQNLIDNACEKFPAKYYTKCTQLIRYYGQSIINLIKSDTDKMTICSRIGKCFDNEQLSWAKYVIEDISRRVRRETPNAPGSQKCTWGPDYWCSNKAAAEKCGVVNFCVEKVWGANSVGDEKSRQLRDTTKKLLGAERCTWGPSYWCSNKATAEECKVVDWCVEKVWGTAKE